MMQKLQPWVLPLARERPPVIRVPALCERYERFLLDAYGVLVDGSGPLPGAAEFIERLISMGRDFVIVSNDASRLPSTAAARYRRFGLQVEERHILTSGSLVGPYLRQESLLDCPCIVLGPADSRTYVEQAGAHIVAPDDPSAEVIIVCDDGGYPFLQTIEAALSTAIHRLDRGDSLHLVLPNPDRIYPQSSGKVGLAAGSVALVIEDALEQRFGAAAPRFTRLGKPHQPIYMAAFQRLGNPPRERIAMIGDQLHTDIAGANAARIDSVLIGTGVSALSRTFVDTAQPTWLLDDLLV